MNTVRCVRCRTEGAALKSNPFRAGTALVSLGEELRSSVCVDCYNAWLKSSVKIINDGKLDLREARAQHVWVSQMRAFLNLGGTSDPWLRFVDRRVRIETTSKVVTTAMLLRADDEKLWLADFNGGAIPSGFAPTQTGADGASGSASILRDCVLTIEEGAE
ncbi:MAG: Fe(2+)-trafficking protein [Myxococcales bacterium]|nr:Fe(2+)-trafficking protein [Myxococcales bacterium]